MNYVATHTRWRQHAQQLWMVFSLLLPALLLCAGPTGAVPSPGLLQLGHLGVVFDSQVEYQALDNPRADRNLETERIDSSIGISLKDSGVLYHPEFLNFTINARFAWRNVRNFGNITGADLKTKGRLDVFRVSTNILPNKPVYLRLSTGRSKTRISGTNIFSRVDTGEDFTIGAGLRKLPLPITAQWQWQNNTRGGLYPFEDQRYAMRLHASRLQKHHRFTLAYGRTAFSIPLRNVESRTQSVDANFSRTPRRALRFQALANWQRQESLTRYETLRGSLRASQDIRFGLSFGAGLMGRRTDAGGRSTTIKGLNYSVSHRLYESLKTSVTQRLSSSRTMYGTVGASDLGIQVAYRKKSPLGILEYKFDFQRSRQDNNLLLNSTLLTQERLTFPPEDILLLDRANIITSTITVRDSSGVEVFVEGQDYRTELRGIFVALVRITTGRIEPRDSVRVTYEFAVDTSGVGGRNSTTHSLRVNFAYGLSASAVRSRLSPTGNPLAFTGTAVGYRNRLGAGWAHRNVRLSWYREEALRSTLFTLDQRWMLSLNGRMGTLGAASGDATIASNQIGLGTKPIESLTINVRGSRALRRNLDLQVNGGFNQRTLNIGRETSNQVGLRLRWQFRRTTLDLDWNFRHYSGPFVGVTDDNRVSLVFQRFLR